MKKDDLVLTVGKNRIFYKEGYVPVTRGQVVKATANEVEIHWFDSVGTATYPTEKIKETGKTKKHQGEEYQHIEITKERK